LRAAQSGASVKWCIRGWPASVEDPAVRSGPRWKPAPRPSWQDHGPMTVRIESMAEPLPGYRLIERLGGGGFGEVWKAEAPGGLLKAIKFVHGDLRTGADDDLRRAEQELKALKRVQTVRHPYLLSLERYDIIEGRLLIVMELAD